MTTFLGYILAALIAGSLWLDDFLHAFDTLNRALGGQ